MGVKPLLLTTVFSISFIIAQAQGTWLLANQKGVSLSYDKEFFASCDENKTKVYKITAYFANNSGKSILISGALIWHGTKYYVNYCRSKVPMVMGEAEFRINGVWPTESLLTIVYYIELPQEMQTVPEPTWNLDPFTFVESPKTTQPATPEWSPWISDNCFQRIKYKYMGKELMNLNYQYHYYFQAVNNYPETIFFVLSLKDATGNERFGTRRSIPPGKTIEFVEKMDQNYIKEMAVEKVCFKTDDGNYLPCDNERGLKPPPLNNAEIIADAKKAVTLMCLQGKYENEAFDAEEKGKSKEEIEKINDKVEKATNDYENFSNLMQKKYDSEKNKTASELYWKYWSAGLEKCPTQPNWTHG